MRNIQLRKLYSPARLSWRWTGDTFTDQSWLKRCGAPVYFDDAIYDHVLDIVGAYGFSLGTPIEEDDLEQAI